jgi:hypothetical protein
MANFVENREGVTVEVQDLGGGVFIERPKENYSTAAGNAYASADNATATATVAARGAGLRNVVKRIIGGFTDLTKAGTVTFKRGSTTVFVYPFTGSFNIPFDHPQLGNAAEAVSAVLSASGTGGVIGHVAILGYQPGA